MTLGSRLAGPKHDGRRRARPTMLLTTRWTTGGNGYFSPLSRGEDGMGKNIRRSVKVTGLGRVAAPPDVLTLTLAIETQAPTVSQSLGENNEATSEVISALRERGVEERDLQTTGLSIDPVFELLGPNDPGPPKIVAFRTRNSLRAKLRDLAGTGSIIDAAIQAGGDASRLEGVS
ncbi:MAG: SIMPL domain-containing protein, partial [Actinomycetota bacterium]